MLYKVSLRNCKDEEVLISEETFKLITENPLYAPKNLLENLGYAPLVGWDGKSFLLWYFRRNLFVSSFR